MAFGLYFQPSGFSPDVYDEAISSINIWLGVTQLRA